MPNVGRPTEYTPELLERARTYVRDEIRQIGESERHLAPAYASQGETVPTIAGLALFLSISRDTVYEWAKIHPEFSDITGEVMALQERLLISKGLKSEYNPTITKLMLTKHGYHDKQDVTSGGKPIPLLDGVRNHPSDEENSEADEKA